jgi:lipopolysaccharide transport system ATP-binding protein
MKIENLSKYYRLGVINNGTLWKDMQSVFARMFGDEDPNTKINRKNVYDKDGFWALSNIDLKIYKGDRVAIMGRNGAGKSTLLKILSRITAPTEGSFHVKGRISSLLEVGTGFHPELTGRDNIFLNGAILGMKRREVAKKFDEIIAFSGIDSHHIDTPVKRYSSGMYVRLGFSVAAHLESDIIIADEVLAVGDLNYMQIALKKMKELSETQGRTILFVSHSPLAIPLLCNKGVILESGKILMDLCPLDEAFTHFKKMMGWKVKG